MAMTWTLTLKDALSGAASKATASLGKLKDAIFGTAAASEKLDKALDKTFRDKMGRLRHSNGKFANEWAELGKKMFGPWFGRLLDWGKEKWEKYGGAIKGVGKGFAALGTGAAVAIGAAVAVGAGIAAVFAQAEEFSSGKQKTLFAFENLLGGPKEARAAWDMVRAAADKTQTSISETAASFNKLLAAGFTLPQTDTLFKQLADLKTLNPQANLDGIIRAIGQIKNTGKLQGDELMQLAEAGVNVSDVYDELQKKLGKTRDEILKLQAAGKIQAADAIEAVQKAIAKKTGSDPGAVAGKAPKSLAETIALAKDAFFELLNLDFKPVHELLGRLTKGEGAAKFADMLQRVFAVITAPAALEFFEKLVNTVGGSFFEGFADGFEAVGLFLQELEGSDLENFAAGAKMVGQALGGIAAGLMFVSRAGAEVSDFFGKALPAVLFGIFLLLPDLVTYIGEKFTALVLYLKEAVPALLLEAATLGAQIMTGLTNGIIGQASAVVAAITGVVGDAIGQAKALLGIASPSKVFAFFGRMSMAGYGMGAEREASRTKSSIGSAIARATQAGRALGGMARNVSSSATSTTNNRTTSSTSKSMRVGDINIHQAPPTEEVVARALRSQMRSLLATQG